MAEVIEWARLTWPEAEEAVRKMPACLLPLGAIEAHGPHMSVDVDNPICEEKCRRICESTGIILLPIIPYGQVWSLNRYPGTLTISFYTLIAIIKDLIKSLYSRGFRVIFIHSHHYGNVPAVKQAVRECYDEMRGEDIKLVYLEQRGAYRAAAKEVCTSEFAHPIYLHADEVETSQALECCEDRVHMDRAVSSYPEFTFDFDNTPTYWDVVTDTGVMGDATAGTKDKGRAIIGAEVEAMTNMVKYVMGEYKAKHHA
ncbi:MAG: creatininase family protein [Bacillota bacterium]|nr:creatininase family protein [Bacillota bacterium]